MYSQVFKQNYFYSLPFKDDEGAPVKSDCPVVRTKSSEPELKSWNASSSSTLQPSDKEMWNSELDISNFDSTVKDIC